MKLPELSPDNILAFRRQRRRTNYLSDVRCLQCKQAIMDDYMVLDELWREANPALTGVLHLRCLEKRIGRKLVPKDFCKVPVNDPDDPCWGPLTKAHLNRVRGL